MWFRSNKTTKTIIDNANTSYDVERIHIFMCKYIDLSTKDNMDKNIHKHIPIFKDFRVRNMLEIFNGMTNRIKELENEKKTK